MLIITLSVFYAVSQLIHYAECRYAVFHYAECCGTLVLVSYNVCHCHTHLILGYRSGAYDVNYTPPWWT
jgi:hypothetical protein